MTWPCAGDYDTITIQAIADAADTTRVTFYRHYRDKDALLLDIMAEAYQDLARRMERISFDNLKFDAPPIEVLYAFVNDNRALFAVLFASQAARLAQTRMRDYLVKLIRRDIERAFPRRRPPVPADLAAVHRASAELGLLIWWLETGSSLSPTYMARVSHWLSLAGGLTALGARPLPKLPPAPVQE